MPGMMKPPITTHPMPPRACTGACSAKLPRRRTATTTSRIAITTETAVNPTSAGQPSLARIFAAGAAGARLVLGAHGLDVSGQLPDLLFGDARAPAGHAAPAPLRDRVEDAIGRRAVEPPRVAQAGAHAAAAPADVATRAVELVEEVVALHARRRVAAQRVRQRRDVPRSRHRADRLVDHRALDRLVVHHGGPSLAGVLTLGHAPGRGHERDRQPPPEH